MAYVTKDEVKAALDAAEIQYDPEATRDDLVKLLEEYQATTRPDETSRNTVTVRVLRDFWTADEERVCKGQIIDVSAEEAMDGMESATLERVKS